MMQHLDSTQVDWIYSLRANDVREENMALEVSQSGRCPIVTLSKDALSVANRGNPERLAETGSKA